MDYLHIVTQMLMLFGVVLTGFAATRRGLWDPALNRKMSVFVLNVSAPCLILSSVMGEGLVFEPEEIMQLMLVSVLNHALLIGGAYFFSGLRPMGAERRGLLRFMLTFGNVTFIGFPVVCAIFGPRSVFYASVLTIPFNVLIFTVGIIFVTGSGCLREAFRPRLLFSPCVVAALAAVVIALFKWQPPAPVAGWFHLVGDMTVPSALLIIGSTLNGIPIRDVLSGRFVYTMAAIRLLLMPLIILTVFRLLGLDSFVTNVAVMLSAMPVGVNGVMFCLQYGRDERLMAQGIFLTTLLSVVTIPLIALALC